MTPSAAAIRYVPMVAGLRVSCAPARPVDRPGAVVEAPVQAGNHL